MSNFYNCSVSCKILIPFLSIEIIILSNWQLIIFLNFLFKREELYGFR